MLWLFSTDTFGETGPVMTSSTTLQQHQQAFAAFDTSDTGDDSALLVLGTVVVSVVLDVRASGVLSFSAPAPKPAPAPVRPAA